MKPLAKQFLVLAMLIWTPVSQAAVVTIDPKDVKIEAKKHSYAYNDITVTLLGQEYFIENREPVVTEPSGVRHVIGALDNDAVDGVVAQIRETILTAATNHVGVTIDLEILDMSCNKTTCKSPYRFGNVGKAFTLAASHPIAILGKKHVTGFVSTRPPIRNQTLRFCVTAYLSSDQVTALCPGASLNELGQFDFKADFTLSSQDRIVGYKYELYTSESASPLSPASEDLNGEGTLASEQHVNLSYVIAGASAACDAGGGARKVVGPTAAAAQ